jgi:hypothetical protein
MAKQDASSALWLHPVEFKNALFSLMYYSFFRGGMFLNKQEEKIPKASAIHMHLQLCVYIFIIFPH